jgi:hypothetical protein
VSPVSDVAVLPVGSAVRATVIVYVEPVLNPCRVDARTATVAELEVVVDVAATPLIVTVTVEPSAAPDVVTTTLPFESSSAALTCVPHAGTTSVIAGAVKSIVTEPDVADVSVAPALPVASR